MADRGFRLTVLTGARTVLDETVESIVAPGTEGYLGVLRHHAPLVTALAPGKLSVTGLDGGVREFCVSGGFMEVRRNVATILVDALEKPEEIDVGRAEAAADRARKRLAERTPGLDVARAEAALARSLNRLRIARYSRRAAARLH